MTNRYSYSIDEGEFRGDFKTREEAAAAGLEAARDCGDADHYWTAENVRPPKDRFVPDATTLGEMVIDRMRDEASDVYEDTDYPDATLASTEEMGRKIAEIVNAWVAEHVSTPDFFEVEDIQKHDVPAAEEEDAA